MARIRSVKPEFWAKEDLATVPRDARLLYIGLWNLSDEHGRLRGNPSFIKGQIFPYDDDLSAADIDELLDALSTLGKVKRYQVRGERFLFLPKLCGHQRLEPEKVASKLPSPGDAECPSESASDADEAAPGADEAARDSDEAAPGAEKGALLYGTGSMEHEEHLPSSDEPMKTLVDLPGAGRSFTPGSDDDPYWRKFWETYPRKAGKKTARLRWVTAIKKAPPEFIVERAERYRDLVRRQRIPPDKIKMAEGWLNGERWTDESLTAKAANDSPYGVVAKPGRITASEVFGA